jgi:hypothetical protein
MRLANALEVVFRALENPSPSRQKMPLLDGHMSAIVRVIVASRFVAADPKEGKLPGPARTPTATKEA